MSDRCELWIATFNAGKLREFKELLKDLPVDVYSATELKHYSAPPEDGKTFHENADIKARSLRALKPEAWVLADDSGLEVSGLGGLPGIHSARYAGPNARPSENNAKLLKMVSLRSPTQRDAQFHCTLVAYGPNGQTWTQSGLLKGEISKNAQGSNGFGYDPIFIPEGESQTLGDLPPSFKLKNSHRARAAQAFKEFLKTEINS